MKNELLVTLEKNTKGEAHIVNANSIGAVKATELNAADDIKQAFALNILAGHVDADIMTANSKHGGLARLFPNMANADRNAIKHLLGTDRADLLAAWEARCDRAKRVRPLSLQALAKAHKDANREPSEQSATFKEQFLAVWENLPAKTRDSAALVKMYDLAIEAGWEA